MYAGESLTQLGGLLRISRGVAGINGGAVLNKYEHYVSSIYIYIIIFYHDRHIIIIIYIHHIKEALVVGGTSAPQEPSTSLMAAGRS